MASPTKPTNPFYFVLLIAGVFFVVTACSYLVMTVNARDTSLGGQDAASSKRFVEIVDRYGFAALMIEQRSRVRRSPKRSIRSSR